MSGEEKIRVVGGKCESGTLVLVLLVFQGVIFVCSVSVALGLNFRHCASCILGQAFRYSTENAFYIFNQQIYFII